MPPEVQKFNQEYWALKCAHEERLEAIGIILMALVVGLAFVSPFVVKTYFSQEALSFLGWLLTLRG